MQINYFVTKWCFTKASKQYNKGLVPIRASVTFCGTRSLCSHTESNTLFTHKRARRLYQDLSLSLMLDVADLHFRACDNHLLLHEHVCAQNLARTIVLQVHIYLCICIEFSEKCQSMVLLISERWRTLHSHNLNQLFVYVWHEKCFECARDIRADDTIRARWLYSEATFCIWILKWTHRFKNESLSLSELWQRIFGPERLGWPHKY